MTVEGPFTLMRLIGKTASGSANNPYGRFWFNERYFVDVVDSLTNHQSDVALVNHYVKLLLRDGMAVCHDWNSNAKIYQMRVPKGVTIEVYVGRAKSQPFFSASDPQG